jgi:hypothetical protein
VTEVTTISCLLLPSSVVEIHYSRFYTHIHKQSSSIIENFILYNRFRHVVGTPDTKMGFVVRVLYGS